MDKKRGYFVISLDFELFWGMFDKYSLLEYGPNVLGERTAIPHMLKLFEEYGIHATWATVGMLMARNRAELTSHLPPPHLRPTYADARASSYRHLEGTSVGESEENDLYHFGPSLVSLIRQTPHQEIANHTFSHFYCIDGHQNAPEVFAADLRAHAAISKTHNVKPITIVFPRNQTNYEALRVCDENGMRAYRGNENHFLYRARSEDEQSYVVRALRLVDHYVNLSGHHTYPVPGQKNGVPLNIPASRFLRPFMRVLRLLEPLRLRRIKKAMTYAAKHGEVFHLWWHPHNFGIHQEENFRNLTEILEHYKMLSKKFEFVSASMEDVLKVVDEQAV